MSEITTPGIYFNMREATYRADPCEGASLTQSLAKLMLERSPLHCWHAHPRLNPDYQARDETKFDVGNIAHTLMLGRGKEIAVLEGFDDWRTKEARAFRALAAKEGKLAVLAKHYAKADRMVRSAREQLAQRAHMLFTAGNSEVCLAWREDTIWLRQLVDWLDPELRTFVDYKTTGESAAPNCLGRKMVNDGWPIQAAMAERGLDILDPNGAGRRQFLFVVQEDEPPYLLNIAQISESALTLGRKRLQMAIDLWRECIESNRWPGYPQEILRPDYPGWWETEWLTREAEHAERKPLRSVPPYDVLMAG